MKNKSIRRIDKFPSYEDGISVYKIPSNIKLGVKDYRTVIEFGLESIIFWWTGLIHPIFQDKPIIEESYNRMIEGLNRLRNTNLNRGKKDKQIKRVLYEELDFGYDNTEKYDWWGEEVPDIVRYDILNEVDNIINIISKKDKRTPNEYLDSYLKKLKIRWGK